MGCFRASGAGLDALPSHRLEARDRARLRSRVHLPGRARCLRLSRRRAPTGTCEEHDVRALPGVHALPQLRWTARQRRSRARPLRRSRGHRCARWRTAPRVAQPRSAPHRSSRVAPEGHRGPRSPRRCGCALEGARCQGAQPGAPPAEGGSHRPLRTRPGGALLPRVRAAHARSGDAHPAAATLRRDCRYLRRRSLVRLRLSGRPTGRVRLRLSLGERVRNDLGFRTGGAQADRPEHASLLELHGARDRGRARALQLRPLFAGRGDASLQAAVGLARRAALVVRPRGQRWAGCIHSVARRFQLFVGPRLWKRLPTPVATALGPRIVRYIP